MGDNTGDVGPKKSQAEEDEAAQMIQRNYRGYRERRQLNGIGLDASARWAEVWRPLLFTSWISWLTVLGCKRRLAVRPLLKMHPC